MVFALKNYRTVFGIISQFKNNCAKTGKKVNTVVKELLLELKVSPVYLMSEPTDVSIYRIIFQ